MAKKGHNYFEMMADMVSCSCRAADMLSALLGDFNIDDLDASMAKLHAVEHEGDELKHQLVGHLVKEFITPIEREDIMAITAQIDDVTDTIEDVLLKIYMYNVREIDPNAVAFLDLIKQCCAQLLVVFHEFSNYKKSKTIHAAVVELNRLEESGDSLYISAVRQLYLSDADAKTVAAWTEIYNCLEKVCDTCEHTVDLVEHVIMKNT